jgi:hypothetical protein
MVFCSQCGSRIPEVGQACPKCGAAFSTNPVSPQTSAAESIDEIITETPLEERKQVNSVLPLADGENILWHRESSRGLIHKQVTLEEAVTNKRCLKYDVENKRVVAQIGINHWPEVVVMNTHRVNDSVGGGVFLTPRMFGLPALGGLGVYGGPRRGYLKVFGDISFMKDGKTVLTFENVKDPQGVRQLVEALKREQGFRGRWPTRPWPGRRMRPQQT